MNSQVFLAKEHSAREVEYELVTADGVQYDVLIEIGKDRDGFFYLPTFYRPHSNNRLKPSEIPLELAVELGELANAAYDEYMDLFGMEVADYFNEESVG